MQALLPLGSVPIRPFAAQASICPPTRQASRKVPVRHSRCRHRQTTLQIRSTAEQQAESKPQSSDSGNFEFALSPEDLPKGVRKEVRIGGRNVLIFWYRNEIFAVEGRSPAEGAYSEGFIGAKLNQDYCIECPSTGTTFDLRTGEIKDWYPSNPVLRLLTPRDTCRNLDVFPVKLTEDAIQVDVSAGSVSATTRGGADLAATKNDVASLEPREFFQGSSEDSQPGSTAEGTRAGQAFTAIVGAVGAVSLAVAGTAVAIYKDSMIGLYIFWAVFVVGAGVYAYSLFNNSRDPNASSGMKD